MIVFVQCDDGLLPVLGSSHRRSGPTRFSLAGRGANVHNFNVVDFLDGLLDLCFVGPRVDFEGIGVERLALPGSFFLSPGGEQRYYKSQFSLFAP
jgi:hypothetical protein